MHNNTKITTFSVKKGHTYITTRKQQQLVKRTATHTQQHENNNIQCEERSHMHIGVKKGHTQNSTKTTTFSIKKVTHTQQH